MTHPEALVELVAEQLRKMPQFGGNRAESIYAARKVLDLFEVRDERGLRLSTGAVPNLHDIHEGTHKRFVLTSRWEDA